MRRFVVACAGLLALASAAVGPAAGADFPRYGAPPAAPYAAPIYAPVYNWSGFYLGINGGGGWGDSAWTGQTGTFDVSGGLIGGTLGYNWQFGQTVVGLEGDLQWSDIKGSGACGF